MTQCVGARRPHMAMGTTSPDAVDISAEAPSHYTLSKDIIFIIERWQGEQQQQEQLRLSGPPSSPRTSHDYCFWSARLGSWE